MAENSFFTAVYAGNGETVVTPYINVAASMDGTWTAIEPQITKDDVTGLYTLFVNNIGEGNCYLRYSIHSTDWATYSGHKLRSVSCNKWIKQDDTNQVSWDFSWVCLWTGQIVCYSVLIRN